MRQSGITTEAAAGEHAVSDHRYAALRARNAQRAVGKHSWPIGLVRLVVVCVLVTQDIKRTPRGDFENRRDGEVRKRAMHSAFVGPGARRRDHATENKPVTLIEERVGTLGAEVSIVLRQQERLQVRRIVDRV